MIRSNNFCDRFVNVASQFFLYTDTLKCGHFQILIQEAINQYLKIVFVYIFKIASQKMRLIFILSGEARIYFILGGGGGGVIFF